MTSNLQGSRPSSRPSDSGVAEPTPTPVITPTGVGGVAVYDRDVDATTNSSLHSPASMASDRVPVETRSSGSTLTWVISIIVLIILVYFLLQFIF